MELRTFSEALSGGKPSLNSPAGDSTYHQMCAGNFLFWISSFPTVNKLELLSLLSRARNTLINK